MSNFNLRVTSMTGFGRFAVLKVVRRNQRFAVLVQLQFARNTRALSFPPGNVPVTELRFGLGSRTAVVEPEKVGCRNNTVPLAVPLAKPSKSASTVSAFVAATAEFVKVNKVPSLTVTFGIVASTG